VVKKNHWIRFLEQETIAKYVTTKKKNENVKRTSRTKTRYAPVNVVNSNLEKSLIKDGACAKYVEQKMQNENVIQIRTETRYVPDDVVNYYPV